MLRSDVPTTIVVLQNHNLFGTLSTSRDSFTKAAEEKVTEKVKDLVDLFRELGPRFHVAVLDTEAYGYQKQLAEVTKDAPELKDAIDAAPENSIFFHANKRVQRLSFNEFLQLDKTASKEANNGRGNLVLLPQGVENFARRVLAVQERRPKVAVCVVHELLTTAYPEGRGRTYTLAGLKNVLTNYGFEVVDIVLKKNWANARSLSDLQPAADTRAESTLERLEGEVSTATLKATNARRLAAAIADRQKVFEGVKGKPWPERRAVYDRYIRGGIEEGEETEFLAFQTQQAKQAESLAAQAETERKQAAERLKQALQDERTTEDRRIADAKAKLAQKLADVDLLIVPRFTIEDATEGEQPDVPSNLHGLRKEQVEVIRDFMKSGKPVLACLGPISPGTSQNPGESDAEYDERWKTELMEGMDDFERLVAERGVELGRETVLFDGETRALAARLGGDQFGGGVPADIPPLSFTGITDESAKSNPVAGAVRLTGRSIDQQLAMRAKALRPVYLAEAWRSRLPFAAEFLATGPDAWNERRPFLQTETRRRPDGRPVRVVSYLPAFEDTEQQDPKDPRVGTRQAERRGPFPVAVALEGAPPAHWTDRYLAPPNVAGLLLAGTGVGQVTAAAKLAVEAEKPKGTPGRLVVVGSGNLFSGPKLDPPQEKLLLHSVNWLTGREDRLPRADGVAWSFPRVEMSRRDVRLWQFGTAIGLPLVAVFLGLMVMMVRRLR
jgi:hypothetical protein